MDRYTTILLCPNSFSFSISSTFSSCTFVWATSWGLSRAVAGSDLFFLRPPLQGCLWLYYSLISSTMEQLRSMSMEQLEDCCQTFSSGLFSLLVDSSWCGSETGIFLPGAIVDPQGFRTGACLSRPFTGNRAIVN